MSVQQLGFDVSAPSAPTATAGTVSGALDASAVYGYKVTFVTGFGESSPSSAGSNTTTEAGSMVLTNIAVDSVGNVIQRKIYRTAGGGSTYLLLATINDNTTTTYTDIIADASLGAAAPTINSAGSLESFAGYVKNSNPQIVTVATGITATAGGAQSGAAAITASVNFVATAASANDSVILPELETRLIGMRLTIRNNGANTIRVYPFTGQQVNSGGADTPATLATVTTANYIATSASNWMSY